MARSPNYNPATHGTGWAPNQPSNAIVAYLNNPVVTNEQRLLLWEQEEVTPPPNFGSSTPTPTPTPTTTTSTSTSTPRSRPPSSAEKKHIEDFPLDDFFLLPKEYSKFIINWNLGLSHPFQRKIEDTPIISLTPTQSSSTSGSAIQPAEITTTVAQNITNPIVENFQQLPPDNITGLFGLKDE